MNEVITTFKIEKYDSLEFELEYNNFMLINWNYKFIKNLVHSFITLSCMVGMKVFLFHFLIYFFINVKTVLVGRLNINYKEKNK